MGHNRFCVTCPCGQLAICSDYIRQVLICKKTRYCPHGHKLKRNRQWKLFQTQRRPPIVVLVDAFVSNALYCECSKPDSRLNTDYSCDDIV